MRRSQTRGEAGGDLSVSVQKARVHWFLQVSGARSSSSSSTATVHQHIAFCAQFESVETETLWRFSQALIIQRLSQYCLTGNFQDYWEKHWLSEVGFEPTPPGETAT